MVALDVVSGRGGDAADVTRDRLAAVREECGRGRRYSHAGNELGPRKERVRRIASERSNGVGLLGSDRAKTGSAGLCKLGRELRWGRYFRARAKRRVAASLDHANARESNGTMDVCSPSFQH